MAGVLGRIGAFHARLVRPWLRATGKKPLTRQIAEMARLARVQRALPYHYLTMMLYKRDCIDAVENYLSAKMINAYQHKCNGGADLRVVNDKVTFDRAARAAGLPVAALLAFVDEAGILRDADGGPIDLDRLDVLRARHGGRLFVKPSAGAHGHGARIADSRDALIRALHPGVLQLFQPVIVQHPDIARFHPASVNSIRIDTLHLGAEIAINTAVLKIGRSGSVVDNGAAGGVFVGIDIATGRLFPTGGQRPAFGTDRLERHPDTGEVFSGGQVPHWSELCALVRLGAETFRPLGSIGWDVAITPDGPLIIEANAFWIATLAQVGAGGVAPTPLGRRALAHHLGRPAVSPASLRTDP